MKDNIARKPTHLKIVFKSQILNRQIFNGSSTVYCRCLIDLNFENVAANSLRTLSNHDKTQKFKLAYEQGKRDNLAPAHP